MRRPLTLFFLATMLALFTLALAHPAAAQAEKPIRIGEDKIREADGTTYVHTSVLRDELGIAVKEIQGYVVLCNDDRCVRLSRKRQCLTDGDDVFVSLDAIQDELGVNLRDNAYLSLDAPAPSPVGGLVKAGRVMPDFTLPSLAGKPIRLSDYRGKRVLLVCWASW